MKVWGDFLGPPRSTDKTTLIIKVSKGAKIRNRYNQVPHLTPDTNGKAPFMNRGAMMNFTALSEVSL